MRFLQLSANFTIIMRSYLLQWSTYIIIVACLSGCGIRPSTLALPEYSNAENTRTSSFKDNEDGYPEQVITFQTRDSPQKVLGFYKGRLVNAGWEVSFDTDIPYAFVDPRDCPYYVLYLTATPGANEMTDVELRLIERFCPG